MGRLIAVLLFLFSGTYAMGQDTTALPTVTKSLSANRIIRKFPVVNGAYFDSGQLALYKSQSVGALLAQQSTAFIRNYGINGLTTLSIRGASSAQTAVRWNGVPIQNGATGICDLSLFPVAMIDNLLL